MVLNLAFLTKEQAEAFTFSKKSYGAAAKIKKTIQ